VNSGIKYMVILSRNYCKRKRRMTITVNITIKTGLKEVVGFIISRPDLILAIYGLYLFCKG